MGQTEEQGVRYSRIELTAMLLLAIWAAAAQSVTPLAVGYMADVFKDQLNSIGLVSTSGLFGATLSCLFVYVFLDRFSTAKLITLGVLISISSNIVCSLASDFHIFLAARFLAGFGDGIIGVSVSVLLAASYKPSRHFGLLVFGMFGVSILIFQLASIWVEPGQGRLLYRGLFLGMALLSPLILCLPKRHQTQSPAGFGGGKLLQYRRAALILLVITAFFMGQGVFFTYAQLVGLEFGIAERKVIHLLTMGSVFALAGATWTAGFGDVFNKRSVIIISSLALAVVIAVSYLVQSLLVFAATIGLFNLLTMVAAPLFMAYLAVLDPSGRLVVWGIVVQTASLSLGPVAAGPLTDQGGFALTLLLAASFFALAMVLAVVLERIPKPLTLHN